MGRQRYHFFPYYWPTARSHQDAGGKNQREDTRSSSVMVFAGEENRSEKKRSEPIDILNY